MNKKNYLATIVFDPRGSDGTSDEMIPRLSEIISDSEGEVIKVENQGTHDFSYPQRKGLSSGTFLQFEINGTPDTPDSIKKKLKLEKKIDRVLIERL
jgi:ribosomal protein S6